MDETRFRELFPRGSADFFRINPQLRPAEREQNQGAALVNQASREEKSDGRPRVRIILRRVRLLDKENAYGATKCLTDCLCQSGIIPDDSEEAIDLNVEQEKVAHRHEQNVKIIIT